jgi:hypothetical protein
LHSDFPEALQEKKILAYKALQGHKILAQGEAL